MKKRGTGAAIVLLAFLITQGWAAGEDLQHHLSAWKRYSPLVWNVGNFALLVYLLYRFGWRKVSSYFQQRQKTIQSQLENAQKARDEVDARIRLARERLDTIAEEIQRITGKVKEEGEAEKSRIILSAQQAVEYIRKEAHRAAEEEVNRARGQLKEEMISLSIQMAEHILHQNLTPEDQLRLIRNFLQEMNELS